ncbi:MAG: DinB family protein [Fimbriimonadaceae bacterium]
MKNHLTEAFEYDLWANLRWLEFQPKATPEEQNVFAHILMAQKLWSDRAMGNSPTDFPIVEAIQENLRSLTQSWIDLISTHDPEEVIHYKRTTGEPKSLQLGEIALHVTNHGTYHRGQIRGLCQARNCIDFPETDMVLYFWAKESI